MDELVAAAAEATGMSEAMVLRSAEARAKAEGSTVEQVLATWAGVELGAESQQPGPAPSAETAPSTEETAPESPPAAEAAAPAGPAGSSEDLAAAAAEATGMSPKMVERSAAARAKSEGRTTEEVLAEWAGVDAPTAVPAASAPPAAAPASAAAVAEPETLDVEVAGEEPPPPDPAVEEQEPEDVVPAGAVPRWLAALFVAVPLFGLAYVGFLPNGPACGDAGQLAVDPVTGVAVNCDGSDYGDAGGIDYFAIGQEVFTSAGCAACHGPGGAGVASFPAFTGGALLTTFPAGSCADHVSWVSLGTAGWPEATYGATDKPVGGSGAVMPGFGAMLSDQELAAVAIYERVAFGGEDLQEAEQDCLGSPEASAEAAE